MIVAAQEDARELSHDYIGTEHLLLGLLGDHQTVPARVLGRHGVTHELVVEQIELIVGRGSGPPGGHIPFTPRAKKTLELALRGCRKAGATWISPAYLLVGVLDEGAGVAAQIVAGAGLDLAELRAEVLAEAGTEQPDTDPGDRDGSVPGLSGRIAELESAVGALQERIERLERG